jgi:lipoprotein-anchoring transpeptidase ErfK/SrfK
MIPKFIIRYGLILISSLFITSAIADDIVISNKDKTLTYRGKIYSVAVGKPSLQWRGTNTITNKRINPTWYPTEKTRRKKPYLPRVVPAGAKNPLGTRALYIGNTMYRIHGTNEPKSIGKAVSSGCIRMHNTDVQELYSLISVGTRVIVK